jgi:hypothetical protein
LSIDIKRLGDNYCNAAICLIVAPVFFLMTRGWHGSWRFARVRMFTPKDFDLCELEGMADVRL